MPIKIQEVIVDVNIAAIAAVLVVISICITSDGFWKLIVDPGLNPNHPSQRTNNPITANDILCPGIAFTFPSLPYFPIRGPRINAPASAAQPPTEWTTVSPAKSINPRSANQPPPHTQCPTIGYMKSVRINENIIKDIYLTRSATAPETIVAAVPQKTNWKKNFPQKGTFDVNVSL